MSELTIRRIGWAAYTITTEAGTKVLFDPYLSAGRGAGGHCSNFGAPVADIGIPNESTRLL